MKKIFSLILCFYITSSFASDTEFYVLFRGFHFTPTQVVPAKAVLETDRNIDCKAPYTSRASLSTDQASQAAESLQRLYNHGPYIQNARRFLSEYDYLQEYYVNQYTQMKQELRTNDSRIRTMLERRCGLPNCDDIFLVSTSLDPYVALKYSAGICIPSDYRRLPTQQQEGGQQIIAHPILGYVDIFFIPVNKMRPLHPYFVVEEFVRLHIDLPYRYRQKDYTLAEEVNFPFQIPGEFHKCRIVVDVSDLPFHKWRTVDDCLRYYLKNQGAVLQNRINQWFVAQNKTRIFMGPLAFRLQRRTQHLVPVEAVRTRNRIEEQIGMIVTQFYDSDEQSFEITDVPVNFYTSYALQNLGLRGYPISITVNFSLQSRKAVHLAPILEGSFINALKLIGNDSYGITMEQEIEHNQNYGIGTNNMLFEEFPWRTPYKRAFESIIAALRKRQHSLQLDITGQSLDRHSYERLIEANSSTEVIDDNRDGDESEEERYMSQATQNDDPEESFITDVPESISSEYEEIEE